LVTIIVKGASCLFGFRHTSPMYIYAASHLCPTRPCQADDMPRRKKGSDVACKWIPNRENGTAPPTTGHVLVIFCPISGWTHECPCRCQSRSTKTQGVKGILTLATGLRRHNGLKISRFEGRNGSPVRSRTMIPSCVCECLVGWPLTWEKVVVVGACLGGAVYRK